MKYIEATKQRIIYDSIDMIPVEEITSFDELNKLKTNTEVTILHNMMTTIGRIYSKDKNCIYIDDGVRMISVYQDSFKYGNYIHRIL